LKPGDKIAVRPKSTKSGYFTQIDTVYGNTSQQPLSWLKSDIKKLAIEVTGKPKREEAEPDINEQLIVEYYSR
jgi:small subunit ribosomal protein S4